ncbi:MAG: hypothetical protein IJ505_04660 [Succinivibrio sp.]|nr:hypothetical protein [Succinivibrio sp.]
MKKLSILLLATTLFLSACTSPLGAGKSFSVQVAPSEELKEVYGYYPTIEVDLALVSDDDAMRFASYPVEKYFEPGNSLRSLFEPVTLHFSNAQLSAKTIESDDKAFERWASREPTQIIMIANLPYTDDNVKTLDPRKFVQKLASSWYEGNSDLYIKIGATGLIKTDKFNIKQQAAKVPNPEDETKSFSLICKTKKNSRELVCNEPLKDNSKPKVGQNNSNIKQENENNTNEAEVK